MWYILWFWRTEGFSPPSLFAFITLITYRFFHLLLPFACLACLCAGLRSRTLVYNPYLTRYSVCWLINITYVILSFCDFTLVYCRIAPIISFRFLPKFFQFPPHVSCLSLFTFHSTLHPPWLPSASLLHLPVCCSLCGLCFAVDVQVSWTEGFLCSVCYSSWG